MSKEELEEEIDTYILGYNQDTVSDLIHILLVGKNKALVKHNLGNLSKECTEAIIDSSSKIGLVKIVFDHNHINLEWRDGNNGDKINDMLAMIKLIIETYNAIEED